ncbi:MAG TPA: hypothetical protein VL134_06590 [Leptolyngbya sp.]|jgi:hypothetical protein|nr:hypothetical protein [Leptolyngbya sp.]
MKIYLERTLSTCPTQLKCVACTQPFEVEKIRSILYDRTGLIQGDLCPTCRSAPDLQEKLQTTEAIRRPKLYQWWFKRLTILSEATQEIESARRGTRSCNCQKPRQIRIRFQENDR